jgi:hypothetical protein
MQPQVERKPTWIPLAIGGMLLLLVLGMCIVFGIILVVVTQDRMKATAAANAKVDQYLQAANIMLVAGDLEGAVPVLKQAQRVPDSTDGAMATTILENISKSGDRDFVRKQLIELSAEDYAALRATKKVPTALQFSPGVLQKRALKIVEDVLNDEAPLLAARQAWADKLLAQKQAKEKEDAARAERERLQAERDAWNASDHSSMAYTMAKEFVKKTLKAPATAQWPGMLDDRGEIQRLDQTTYSVKSWVDSQNSFGALIRTNYVVILREEGSDWRLISLNSVK